MAKKYVSTKKYSYDEGAKKKKILLIVAAIVLVLVLAVVAAVAIFLLGGGGNVGVKEPSFTIQSFPDKTTFYVGEPPVFTGLQVVLTTAEGNSVTLGPDNCKITGFNSSAPAKNQVITVQYKEYTASFTIDILAASEKPVDKQFTGKMTFKTLPKTSYKVGESLKVDGGVLLMEYEDGSKDEMAMTEYMLDGFVIDGELVPSLSTSKAGKFKVQVSYLEDAQWAYAYYDITVTQ